MRFIITALCFTAAALVLLASGVNAERGSAQDSLLQQLVEDLPQASDSARGPRQLPKDDKKKDKDKDKKKHDPKKKDKKKKGEEPKKKEKDAASTPKRTRKVTRGSWKTNRASAMAGDAMKPVAKVWNHTDVAADVTTCPDEMEHGSSIHMPMIDVASA
mmetsp:Transcript_5343/g.8440  ORF Transcript_5343/g.8440 Transcript_5343/m.8440 type:complete len:159 (+) Transcript_5343:107-583(+)